MPNIYISLTYKYIVLRGFLPEFFKLDALKLSLSAVRFGNTVCYATKNVP